VTTYLAYDVSARKTKIGATIFAHAALFLFPAVVIALPTPSTPSFSEDLFIGFSAIINTWVALLFVILQFYPQISEYRRLNGDPGVLSLLSIGMQAIVYFLLAVRWLLRLGHTTWGNKHAPLSYWYQWGWLPCNYLIHGIGCLILLALYLRASRSEQFRYSQSEDGLGERVPLIV
jgi:hypothetical protein